MVSTLRRTLGGVLACAGLIALLSASHAAAYLSDSASHPPPTTGGQAFSKTNGAWMPGLPGFPGKGQSFIDPVFGNTIMRLTNEVGQHSYSDIYAKNGNFNADNTLIVHTLPVTGKIALNVATGAPVRALPGNDNSSFDPVNPDIWWWYTFGGTTLNKFSVSTGVNTVVKDFGVAINNNGGSTDWIDRTGEYMLLRLGNTWRIYDVAANALYSGAISDVDGGGAGWGGMSPDGNWVVTTNDPPNHKSFKIDHATKSVAKTGTTFWSLCGDHGDLVSASDGKTYMVTYECDSVAGVYAVDVSIPQSTTNKAKQRADNRMLFKTSWSDSGHFSGVSKGALQDWAFISVESGDDTFGSSVRSWRPYESEIVMANVVTGEVRRLAHHRSRSVQADYYYTPRVSASWDGSLVSWASNFGNSTKGYADIYVMRIDGATGTTGDGGGTTNASAPTVSFTNPASGGSVSGIVTVSIGARGGTGSGYTYAVKAGTDTIYTGTNPSFSWNTATSANGSLTLTVTVTDTAGASGSATREVTVANIALSADAHAFASCFLV